MDFNMPRGGAGAGEPDLPAGNGTTCSLAGRRGPGEDRAAIAVSSKQGAVDVQPLAIVCPRRWAECVIQSLDGRSS